MRKIILISCLAALVAAGCTTSIGLGAGRGGFSTSASVSKEIKKETKDSKESKKIKETKDDTNSKKKVNEKRVKQIREDNLNKTVDEKEIKDENILKPLNQRIKQPRN